VSGDGSVSSPTAAPQPPAVRRLSQQLEQTPPWQHKPQPRGAFVLLSPEIRSAMLDGLALAEKPGGRRVGSSSRPSLWHPLSWRDQSVHQSLFSSLRAACPPRCHCPQDGDEGWLMEHRDPQRPAPYTYRPAGMGPSQAQNQVK